MIRTDVELGDIRTSPKRLGGFSRRPLDGDKYEVGFCVAMPIQRFHLGAVVALKWDDRQFIGAVSQAEEGDWNGQYCVRVKTEGRFTT